MSEIITKTLYRSLLRTAKPFASNYNGPKLCSLLYRNGYDDDDAEFDDYFRQEIQGNQNTSTANETTKTVPSAPSAPSPSTSPPTFKNVNLSQEEARDLSRTYDELRKIHFQRQQGIQSMQREEEQMMSSKDNDNDTNENNVGDGWSTIRSIYDTTEDMDQSPPHIRLYKKILRQIFYDDHDLVLRHMYFPSQTMSLNGKDCIMGQKLIDIIRREFRAKNKNSAEVDKIFSHLYTDSTRRETGFLALRELQKKLTWAESMGMRNLFHYSKLNIDNSDDISDDMSDDNDVNSGGDGDDDDDDDLDDITANTIEKENQKQAAYKDVNTIPTQPTSSYLQPGAYLIAHPMLSGTFYRSVICILQHTDIDLSKETKEKKSTILSSEKDPQKKEDDDDDNDSDNDIENETYGIVPNRNGGTYGLIINEPLMIGVPNSDSIKKRYRTLRETIRHDCLPQGIKLAFGNCPVRNGGPVNMSIQMLRISTSEEEEKFKIGGSVLPMVLNEGDSDGDDNDDKPMISTAMYSDKAVYFGGDIIKAAQFVLDGQMESDSFSFVIGASCWELGQLESEVARGYWLPCGGPPEIAFRGGLKDVESDEDTPDGNTWLSMMSLLGEKEGEVARLVFGNRSDNNGSPCDEV